MDDNIKLYESLLNELASIEKECLYIYTDYIKEFGEAINQLFEAKIESIALKKKITYCVKKQYKGETIYSNDLDNYIDSELLQYKMQLEEMIEEKKEIDEAESHTISYSDVRKIKKLYYTIVHMIHPDLHPEYKDNDLIKDFWQNAQDAYKRNDYNKLMQVYDAILIAINKYEEKEIVIDNIVDKIKNIKKEIETIKIEEPYTYKFLLNDEDEKDEFHSNLKKEYNDYKEYIEKLNKDLQGFYIVERQDS